jgi:LysR family glycine cleavage system transcriptional activator
VAHYWLFPRVVCFNQEHPDITVNIVSTNAVNERRCNDCDLGILYGDGEWPSLSSTLVFPEIVYPICSARYEVEAPQSPDDLRKLPLIQVDAREWGWLTWQDWFEHFGLEYEIPRNALTFNQLTLSLEATIEGVGIGLGWEFMAGPAIAAGRLRKLGDFDFVTGRSDYLVHVKHRHLSSAARTLHDWLLASAEGAGSAAS